MKGRKHTTQGGTAVFATPLHARKPRFWELDFFRGLFVLFMCWDHFAYIAFKVLPDLNVLFDTAVLMDFARWARNGYWLSEIRGFVRPFILFGFLVLCGIGCTLSKDNYKRSGDMMLVALIISSVTYVLDVTIGGLFILFGVVHMLSVSVALYCAVYGGLSALARRVKGRFQGVAKWTARLAPALLGGTLLVVYFCCFANVNYGDIEPFPSTVFPPDTEVGKMLGGLFVEFRWYKYPSTDYYPLLPYAAIVLVGTLFGWIAYRLPQEKWGAADRPPKKWNAPICWVGRKAIWFYLFHQVAAMAFFFLCCLFASL